MDCIDIVRVGVVVVTVGDDLDIVGGVDIVRVGVVVTVGDDLDIVDGVDILYVLVLLLSL